MEDEILLAKLKQGDQLALKCIHDRMYMKLMYYCKKFLKSTEVAEEIVDDTFLKVWDTRTSFHDIEKLYAYMYVVVKNACLNVNNKADNRVKMLDIQDVEDLIFNHNDVLKNIILTELVSSIFSEIEDLPKSQREVFLLTFVEGLTAEEIVVRNGMTLNSVYANKSRAIAALKKKLNLDNLIFSTLLSVLFVN